MSVCNQNAASEVSNTMKRTVSKSQHNSLGATRSAAAHLAQTYISRDSQETLGMSGQFFPRDQLLAKRTEEAVMASVLKFGLPIQSGRWARPFLSKRFSWTMALAAALVIAFVSSVVTLGLLRSSSTVSIRFVLSAPGAQSVNLVADFNDWSPEGYNLSKSLESGEWELVVPLRKGRSYVYNFVIDGEYWLPDPSAQGTIDDGLGGKASYISL